MQTQYTQVGQAKMAFYDNQNHSASYTLLFIHGNSMNFQLFESMLSQPTLAEFRLIAIDLPGHGKSPWAEHPALAYRFNALKETLSVFIEQMGLNNLILCGHSLGGHLAIQLVPLVKHRVTGLVISGTPPLRSLADGGEAFMPSVALQYAYSGNLLDDELNLFAEAFGNGNHTKAIADAVRGCDTQFRPALGASLANDSFENEQEILNCFKPKTLVLQGENDQLINRSYLEKLPSNILYGNNIQIIPQAGHMAFIDNPHQFSVLIQAYVLGLNG